MKQAFRWEITRVRIEAGGCGPSGSEAIVNPIAFESKSMASSTVGKCETTRSFIAILLFGEV